MRSLHPKQLSRDGGVSAKLGATQFQGDNPQQQERSECFHVHSRCIQMVEMLAGVITKQTKIGPAGPQGSSCPPANIQSRCQFLKNKLCSRDQAVTISESRQSLGIEIQAHRYLPAPHLKGDWPRIHWQNLNWLTVHTGDKQRPLGYHPRRMGRH